MGKRGPKELPPIGRFLKKVHRIENGCIIFTGKKDYLGYGQFYINLNPIKTIKAHRFSYQFFKESINKNDVIYHSCENKRCVNPDHLFKKSVKYNFEGKRWYEIGNKHPYAILNEKDIIEIRSLFKNRISRIKDFCEKISHQFKISKYTVKNIIYNKDWKHIQNPP
jgi:hypothetical protein